jgi:hypothetical protein
MEYNVCKISRSGYAVAVPDDVICHLPELEDEVFHKSFDKPYSLYLSNKQN